MRSGKFRIFYTDHENRPTSHKGYHDRGASVHLMQELVSQAERIHAGLLSPRAARPRLTVSALLERWERYILANGATPRGARRQRRCVADVAEGISAVRVSDLTPSSVLEWIDERRRANRHKGRAFGHGTAANYLGAAKSFTRWCATVEHSEPSDYLSGVPTRRAGTDPRLVRRSLSSKELSALLFATKRSEEAVYGLTGQERHALYLVACSTGLRASELARLDRASFDLASGEVTIRRPAKTRTRTADTLPIDAVVLKAVKPLLARSGPLWPNRVKPSQAWWSNGARMIRRDLEAAGIPFLVDGRRFDFHSLRGQFATDLDRVGVSLPRVQKLMRHSDPKLTSRHYTKPEREEMRAEVGKLKRGRR